PVVLNVLPYTPIKDPEPVLIDFTNEVTSSIQNIRVISSSSANLKLLEDIVQGFKAKVNELSPAERLELAYYIMANKPRIESFEAAHSGKRLSRSVDNDSDRLVE